VSCGNLIDGERERERERELTRCSSEHDVYTSRRDMINMCRKTTGATWLLT
jgi:hypothetical protein